MFSLSVMESLCKVVLGAQQKAPNLNALNALNATFKSTFCLSKWFLGQYLCKRPQKSVSCYWQICSGSIFKVLSLKIFWWGILKCMMMMIGQMMKLRKQARSIWQRGALEWWSGASALSADGYWTNTILSGSPSWFLPSGLPSLKWTNTILSGWFWNVRGVMGLNYGSNLDPACLLVINENKVGDDYFTLTLVRCHKLCFRANLFWQDYMMIVWTMFLEHGGMIQ